MISCRVVAPKLPLYRPRLHVIDLATDDVGPAREVTGSRRGSERLRLGI